MPYHVSHNTKGCSGYAVIKDSDGKIMGCHDTKQEADDQMAALYASEDDARTMEQEHFHAIMVTEGESTGLRTFTDLTWREPPFAFHEEYSSAAHGGQMMTRQVGLVTRVERDGPVIHGWGRVDINSETGSEYARRLVGGFARWVSIGLDEQPIDTKVEFAEGDEDDPMAMLFGRPDQVHMSGGRIGELTSVSVPALDSAIIEPTQALIDLFPDDTVPESEEMVAADHVVVIPDCPPRSWFFEPTDVTPHGSLTVTDEGRIYGYVAPADVKHRNPMFKGAKVPMGKVDYSKFMSRETIVEGGERIVTGCITMECGHAPVGVLSSVRPASEHYDNSCSVLATVRVGENKHGVWVAGALLPDVTAGQVARAMACQLSGDWRGSSEKRGWREFAGLLLVPVPGFPMARTRPSVDFHEGEMVASAVPVVYETTGVTETETSDCDGWKAAQALLVEAEAKDRQAELVKEMETI